MTKVPKPKLTDREFSRLADFRYQIRRFLAFSQAAAEAEGIQPQQHQALLAVRGFPADQKPTVADVAERLQIRHNTAVELVDRCISEGLLSKSHNSPDHDRRKVVLKVTEHGAKVLAQLSAAHLDELRVRGPELVEALQAALEIAEKSSKPRKEDTRARYGVPPGPTQEELEQWAIEQWQKHKQDDTKLS